MTVVIVTNLLTMMSICILKIALLIMIKVKIVTVMTVVRRMRCRQGTT